MLKKALTTKYAYDLGIWYAFYLHCHELEDTFVMDDELRKCPDIASPEYPGDLTTRHLTWDAEESFHATEYQKLKHHYSDEKYKAYIKANNDEEHGRKKAIIFTVVGSISLILLIANLNMVIYGSRHQKLGMIILGSVILFFAALAILIELVLFFKNRQTLVTLHGENKMVNKVMDFDSWFDTHIKDTEAWVSYYYDALSKYKRKLEEGINSQTRKEDYQTLVQARKYLTSMIDIPSEYTDEYHIRLLFDLYLFGKGTSLEAGLKMLKDPQVIEELTIHPLDKSFVLERFTDRIENNRKNENPDLLRSLEPNRFIFKTMEHLNLTRYTIDFEDILP